LKQKREARTFDVHRYLDTAGLVVGSGMTLTGLKVQLVPLALVLLLSGLAIGIPSLRSVLPPGTLRLKAGLPAAIVAIGLVSLAFFGGEAFLPVTLISIRCQNTIITGIALTSAS